MWFGDHTFSQVEVEKLKTLTDGLKTLDDKGRKRKHRYARNSTAVIYCIFKKYHNNQLIVKTQKSSGTTVTAQKFEYTC